jgi:hypothetical protein
MQSLNDLIDSFHLYAVCEACQRQTKLDIEKLISQLGPSTQVHKMRSKLKCRAADRAPKIYGLSMWAKKIRKRYFNTAAERGASGSAR